MGLDVSHDAWTGAYSSFSRWRAAIASTAGYALITDNGHEGPAIAHDDRWTREHYDGVWNDDPGDVLLVLLVHSDCDGTIPARFCGPLARRLRGLLPYIVDTERDAGPFGHRARTEQFIAGLELADSLGDGLEFR